MDQYTWSTFKAAVMEFLPIDANRKGVKDANGKNAFTVYNDGLLRQGVIRLQSLVPSFKLNHEAIYQPNDLVVDGKASRGVKPPQSTLRDVWLFETSSTDRRKGTRHPVTMVPWEDRFSLINGSASVIGSALMAVDPQGYQFLIYPEVFDGWMVSMFWDGAKLEFQDDELVPFTEQAVLVVAQFMRSEIEREVKRDLPMAGSFALSAQQNTSLVYLNEKEQR